MQQFAPFDVIVGLSNEMSHALDHLPDAEWKRLALASRNLELPLTELGDIRLPSQISLRLAALLSDRLSRDDGLQIYKQYLVSYTGDDRYVLQKCADLAFRGLWQVEIQQESLQIIENAYKKGVCPVLSHSRLREEPMPIEAARRICSEPMHYPLSILGAAEPVLTGEAGSRLIPVGRSCQERCMVRGLTPFDNKVEAAGNQVSAIVTSESAYRRLTPHGTLSIHLSEGGEGFSP